MSLQINKVLNLVVPVATERGMAYAYSIPIDEETFKKFYLVIGKTFAGFYSEGLAKTGIQAAVYMLEDVATRLNSWEPNPRNGLRPEDTVSGGLVAEMKRLTMVYVPTGVDDRFEPVPIDEAVKRDYISSEDMGEVLNVLTFFTVGYKMHLRAEREAVLSEVCTIWGARVTSSSFTAWLASLKTSTQEENTGEKPGSGAESRPTPEPTAPPMSSVAA